MTYQDIYLILGVILWCLFHSIPVAPMDVRPSLVSRYGEAGYRRIFIVLSVVPWVLIVSGWRSSSSELIINLDHWANWLCNLSMIPAFLLITTPCVGSNIRRFVRHPQLTGVAIFSFGHLLASGQFRSLILFGGIGTWAISAIWMINRRDGAWRKPVRVGGQGDVMLIMAGMAILMISVLIHEAIFGRPVFTA